MLSLLLSTLLSPPSSHQENVLSYMEAERAFSSMGAEKGFRESFLHFFAPEGIGFKPEAHVVRDELSKQEPEKMPLDYQMSWEPVIADCSSTADMGFTTGPLEVVSGSDRPVYMSYFSIWERQKNGDLRVVFDLGTPVAVKPSFPAMTTFVAPVALPAEKEDVEKRAKAGKAAVVGVLPQIGQVHADFYGERFVAHRPGSGPIFSAKAMAAWQKETGFEAEEGELRGARFSLKADFGWAWGSYKGQFKSKAVEGYWAQVWKHEASGWHIVAEVISTMPPKA